MCDIINAFTVTFDQFNASILLNRIHFSQKQKNKQKQNKNKNKEILLIPKFCVLL